MLQLDKLKSLHQEGLCTQHACRAVTPQCAASFQHTETNLKKIFKFALSSSRNDATAVIHLDGTKKLQDLKTW